MRRFIWLSVMLVASCARTPEHRVEEKKYQLDGVIVRLDPQLHTAVIKHGEIKGWMEPMTMEFPVPSQDEFDKLREGQTIRAAVFVRGLDYSIGEIQIDPH